MVARKSALALGWEKHELPRAHSGRNSMVPSLMKLNQNTKRIETSMGWSANTQMLTHYMSNSLDCSDKGSAYLLGSAIENGTHNELTSDII